MRLTIGHKMGTKAKNGGTLGRAPVGYLNTRENIDGREIRTVTIDPERGPLIQIAFKLYATGEWTLEALCDELTDRGLLTKRTRTGPGPISISSLHNALRNPYYLGLVTYEGDIYQGRHDPLIDFATFERVQTVLDAKGTSSERQRTTSTTSRARSSADAATTRAAPAA